MKKSVVLAIIAVMGTAASTVEGNGTVGFENYFSSSSPTINYSSNPFLAPYGKAGLALGSEFSAELAYYPGITYNLPDLTLLSSSITPFGVDPISHPAADGQVSYGAGWFWGPGDLELPGTTQEEVVTLDVFAFNNGSLGASTIFGSSGAFQVTLGGGVIPPALLRGTPGASFTVTLLSPEPTTLALGGLGLATLMLFRRKQA